jgi:type I restriction enzyme S subunit
VIETKLVPATTIFDIEGGTQPPKSEFIYEPRAGYSRLVQIRDFESNAHPTYIQSSPKWRKCDRSDTLIGRYGAAVGRICRGLSGYYNVALVKVVPRIDVDNNYLYYLLRSEYFQQPLLAGSGRSAQSGFNRDDLKVIDLPLPSKERQSAIGNLLNTLDEKIELNRQMNETLEASARALFRDWFADFGPTKAKMADDAPYLAPDLWTLFPDQLDEHGVPRGWQTSTIGEEVTSVGGGTPSTKNEAFWNGDIAWTTPKDLSGLQSPALLETARSISKAGLTKISSGLLPVGTVLLSSRAPVGYLAITQIPMAVNQGYIAMKCEGRVSNCFVYLWAKENRSLISQNANGSTFQEISKKNFRPLPILVPDTKTREAFDSLVKPLFDRIVANEKENRTLAETRDLLLPKLMSGEIRVGDAEQAVDKAV